MIDPEIDYQRIVSGDAASITGAADTLADVGHDLDDARSRIHDAAATTDWSGPAAVGFQARVAQLANGVNVNRSAVARGRGALDVAAAAYGTAVQNADFYISFWRNRPSGLIAVFEELLALAVRGRLVEVSTAYSQQLTGVAAVLRGQDVDLDQLDEETRAWVEQGLAKNREWAKESGSTFGPLIPNTAATGDDRGLTPQGLAYDPRTGTYVMSYYPDGDHPGPATLALVDAVTGQEIGDVDLAGVHDPSRVVRARAVARGGVSVQGDDVIVVDKGKVFTYSMSDIRAQASGTRSSATAVQSVRQAVPTRLSATASSTSATTRPTRCTSTRRTGRQLGPGPRRRRPSRGPRDAGQDTGGGGARRRVRLQRVPNRFNEGALGLPGPHHRGAQRSLPAAQHVGRRGRGRRPARDHLRVDRPQYDDDGSPVGWIPMVPDDDNLWANPTSR